MPDSLIAIGGEPETIDPFVKWFRDDENLAPVQRIDMVNASGWCKIFYPEETMPLIEEKIGMLLTMLADALAERYWGKNEKLAFKRHGTPFLLDGEDRDLALRLQALAEAQGRTKDGRVEVHIPWVFVDRQDGCGLAAICCIAGRTPAIVRKMEASIRQEAAQRAAWVANRQELAVVLRRLLSGGPAVVS
ncbi:hypothetical protein GCM10011504_57500 [Siccirubricoccus deserti]|uniref:Uncharacterized protein n=1 Tax=Siccirubricoccus deserti TaxID=2013562 RepID=A0A9X0UFU4_9PROT|nr:hypothetical protein [Siccirubricoccus deserti]MBC4019152.1 hypothetical protein [Siccirubricoccus deserti]GGC72455.1 hypothetical protein GCM10011504_57500 [Siccirubricoccus deserti]